MSNQNAVGPLDHLQYTQEQWQAAAAAAERMRAALGVPRRQAKGSFQPYVVIAMVAVLVLISLIAGAVQVRADRLAARGVARRASTTRLCGYVRRGRGTVACGIRRRQRGVRTGDARNRLSARFCAKHLLLKLPLFVVI